MNDVIERLTKLSKVGFGYDITFEDREALKDAVAALSASPVGVGVETDENLRRQMSDDYGCGPGGLTREDVAPATLKGDEQ